MGRVAGVPFSKPAQKMTANTTRNASTLNSNVQRQTSLQCNGGIFEILKHACSFLYVMECAFGEDRGSRQRT
jgi:hypothetical protein